MRFFLSLTAVCFVPAWVAGAPSTAPSEGVPSVDRIPVPAARVAAGIPSHIAVFPFQEIGDVPRVSWIGNAVSRNLATAVARTPGLSSVALDASTAPATSQEARSQSLRAGADTLVWGSYQFAGEGDVRMTAEVVDAGTGRSVAGLKASGSVRDLFQLEDQLEAQLRAALRSGVKPAPPALAAADPAIFNGQFSNIPAQQQAALASNVPVYSPAVRNYYYSYNTYYSSPLSGYGSLYGGYGYGGFGGYGGYANPGYGQGFGTTPIIIVNNNGGSTGRPVQAAPAPNPGHLISHAPPAPGMRTPFTSNANGSAAR